MQVEMKTSNLKYIPIERYAKFYVFILQSNISR